MIDIVYWDVSIRPLIRSILERIESLNRLQALHTFADGIPDEAIEIESDKLIDVLKMYERLGLLEFGAIRPGRWSQWI